MRKNWFDKKMKHLTSRVSVSTWKKIQIKCKTIPLLKQNLKINISYQIIQHQRSLVLFVKDRSILLLVGTKIPNQNATSLGLPWRGVRCTNLDNLQKKIPKIILLEKSKHPSTNQSWWPMEDPCKQHWEGWWNETFVK